MPGKKLCEDQVEEILEALMDGCTGKDISEAVGLAQSTISDIKRGKTWAHVRPEIKRPVKGQTQ